MLEEDLDEEIEEPDYVIQLREDSYEPMWKELEDRKLKQKTGQLIIDTYDSADVQATMFELIHPGYAGAFYAMAL